jgi:membrane protease YdiL (CAAX protease family)
VIILIVGVLVGLRMMPGERLRKAAGEKAEAPAESQALVASEMEDRILVGMNELRKRAKLPLDDKLPEQEMKSAGRRLRFAIVAGEMSGPAKALELLDAAQFPPDTRPDEHYLRGILERLYRDYNKGDFTHANISTADENFIKAKLGWLGELALYPQGSPKQAERDALLEQAFRTVVVAMTLFFGLLFAGFLGLISLFLLVTQLGRGRLNSKLEPPLVNGNLYVETFALWLVGFIIFSLLAGAFSVLVPLPSYLGILVVGSPLILALIALAWPVARNVPWAQVRQEIGLTTGAGVLTEVLAGIRCYFTALPLVAVGLVLTLLLMRLQGQLTGTQPTPPSHPVVEMLSHPSPADLVCLLFLLSVVAPLSEETAFRGILYRHLREASWGMRTAASIVLSATISSFIFAAIHPQGPFGIPLLMALACAFCGARELRGSLIPSMVAHGMNNGLVLLAVVFVTGG